MKRELSKAEVERLFSGKVDGELPAAEAERFDAELATDEPLRQEYERYERAVTLLRKQPREKAPDALASMILRRTRRRRNVLRNVRWAELQRLPVEVAVALVIAALVAMYFVLTSQ